MERILLTAPRLDLRGTTLYTLTLAREMRLRGYKIGVMSSGGIFTHELRKERVPFIQADVSGFFPRDYLYMKRIRGRAKEFGPDLIHVTHHCLSELGGNIADKLAVPYVITIQKPITSTMHIYQRVFRKAIAVDSPIRQSAVNAGRLPREKVTSIKNGIATNAHPPPRRDGTETPVVGTVCHLDKDHGVKYFIHTARELVSRGVKAQFLILGSGPYEKKFRHLIRKLSLQKRVTMTSAMPSCLSLVSPIDIFVSPVLSEGSNSFILQAMAWGIPVVVSAVGGIFSLVIDNETGLIVPKKDVSVFADKIAACLDDKEFADRIGKSGFDFVQEHYPLPRMLESTLNAYSDEEGEAAEINGS